jgi:hypothetical protein
MKTQYNINFLGFKFYQFCISPRSSIMLCAIYICCLELIAKATYKLYVLNKIKINVEWNSLLKHYDK